MGLKSGLKLIWLAAVLFILYQSTCFSAEVTLTPAIGASLSYNDNILFFRDDEIDDYISTITPSLNLDYTTERGFLSGNALLDIINYYEEDQLNTTNQDYRLDGGYSLSERFSVYAESQYIMDTTLESELDETGRVTFREDRQRFDILPGMSFNLTEISMLNLDYSFTTVDYELDESVDYDKHRVRLRYSHKLSNQVDTLSLAPGYVHMDSDTIEADTYNVTVGWVRKIAEIYSINIFLGYRHTEQESKVDNEKRSSDGGVFDINLIRRGETTDLSLKYGRNITFTPSGGLIEVDRFRLDIFKQIVARFGIGLLGGLNFSRDVDERVNEDSYYFDVQPYLRYNITENHSISAHYNYSYEYDDALEDDKLAMRNRVWVALNLQFPQKW